jgi:sortase (surface protein transpeptidase)
MTAPRHRAAPAPRGNAAPDGPTSPRRERRRAHRGAPAPTPRFTSSSGGSLQIGAVVPAAIVATAAVFGGGAALGASGLVPDAPGSASSAPAASGGSASGAASDGWSLGRLQDPEVTAPAAQDAPARVAIPSLGVDSALETLELEADGRLAAPVDPDLAGWYADGPAPGEVGPSIIAGHVDSATGPAVFARLGELATGDVVTVTLASGGTKDFVVRDRTQTAKAEFPTSEVYGNVPVPELRLITCGGAFDASTGHYVDNLVVFLDEA